MGKKILIFSAGVITGAVLMILIALMASKGNATDDRITIFETKGECVSSNSFEVFQVLDSGDALAKEFKHGMSVATGITVLFFNDGDKSYYDGQIIKIPSGKCAKQIGVFKYATRAGVDRTVPIVEIQTK